MGSDIKVLFFCIALLKINGVLGQENAGTSVSPSLEECYNDTRISTRDYRLPATITTLISLIRKIEYANPSVNARELSIQLLHRFRQDGIWKNDRIVDQDLGLPYSPRRWESFKNVVQLKKLTPGNAQTFNNDSLTVIERCSLHSMISSTIETNERGDEGTVCNQISRYTSRIQKREKELTERVDTFSSTRSTCPIESGVVYTKWGAVKAGLVLAGIAAGLNREDIPVNGTIKIDNRWASTIAGELSEAALYQASSTIKIGCKGGWNDTVVPKYYFLQEQERLQVTDAELRGGLDGLYMALNIDAWKSKMTNLRISDILEMYYSARGVLNDTMRACNRKRLVTGIIRSEKLTQEVSGFNYILDDAAIYNYSPHKKNFQSQAVHAVDSFNNYIASLNDLECSAEDPVITRASTDLIIFVDTAWNFNTIQPFISYILQNINIDRGDSSYTILDGVNCDTIVNKSRNVVDFYQKYNLTEQQKYPNGFDYNKVIQVGENLLKAKLNNESDITGQSTVVLLIPHNQPNDNQKDNAHKRRTEIFKYYLPDLKILVAGSGSKETYSSFVANTNNDVFIINDSVDDDSIKASANSVVNRLQQIPRSVVNPKCKSSFKTGQTNSFDLVQYVEPQVVNYHRIASNYFITGNDDNRKLKIKGQGFGRLSVCLSRSEANPKNSTGDCKTIASDEASYNIKNYCDDDSVSSCSPIYISIEGLNSEVRCTETTCRFPDSIKYIISLENVGCSGAGKTFVSALSIVFCAIFFAVTCL